MNDQKNIFGYLIELIKNPRETFKVINSEDWNRKQIEITSLFIVSEIIIIVSCFQYWWFGQIYVKTSIFLISALLGLCVITAIIAPKKYWRSMWIHQSIYLLCPAILSSILNIIFRLGYIPYIESYLYRSVLMDVLFIVFVLGSIIYRSINRNIIIEIIKKEERKSERMQKILQIILFVFDIGIGFGLAELLINIKDVLIIL